MVQTGWPKLVFATYWQKLAKTKMECGFLPLTAFATLIKSHLITDKLHKLLQMKKKNSTHTINNTFS